MNDDPLTHFDAEGGAHMVSIEDKAESKRSAVARAYVRMHRATCERIMAGGVEKGDVLGAARLAGIGAAKRTAELIPLCHPVRLTSVEVRFEPDPDASGIAIEAQVRAVDRTGPEMEALCVASVAALTIYDMCKAMDRAMVVESVMLIAKSGGKSGAWTRGSGG